MLNYRRGAKGPEVSQIQSRLRDLGLYRGPIDGDFGGGTESATRTFQRAEGLLVDGAVGSATWTRLFPGTAIVAPAIAAKPLAYRALALTGAFETQAPAPDCFSGLSGDFDGQGLSFGVCQWNLGQGSLQPLLSIMDRNHASVVDDIFGLYAAELRAMLTSPQAEQLAWARSIQDGQHRIAEPWRGLFKTLGRRDEFQAIEVESAGRMYQDALAWCRAYAVNSERALALMFDIRVQNGSIGTTTRARIEQDYAALPTTDDDETGEIARLRVIANRRAEAATPQWVEDVRARKLTIALGVGTVHGAHYDLETQYGIGLKPAVS